MFVDNSDFETCIILADNVDHCERWNRVADHSMNGTVPIESRSSTIKERIVSILASDPILRGVLIIGTGTALSQILRVLFVPILTRIYPPAIYGTLAIFTSVLSILIVLSTFRYDTPVPMVETDEDAEYLMIISFLITGVATVILLIVTIVHGGAISKSLNLEFLSPHFWLLGVYFFILSTFGIITHWVLRERGYGKIARAGVSQSVSGSTCKIILGLLGFGSFGLIFGEFIALVTGIGVLGGALIPRLISRVRNLQIEKMIHLAREFKRFPIYSVPSGLINELSLQAPTLLISMLFGFETVGYFSLSYSMLVMPISLISGSIAQVFYGESSELLRTKSQELLGLYRKTTRRLFMFGTPVIFTAAVAFPVIFPLVFGSAWKDAGIFIIPLSIMVLAQFVVSSTNRLEVYGYNNWELAWDTCRTLLVIGGFYCSHMLRLEAVPTIYIYSITMTFMYVICYILNVSAIVRVQRMMATRRE